MDSSVMPDVKDAVDVKEETCSAVLVGKTGED